MNDMSEAHLIAHSRQRAARCGRTGWARVYYIYEIGLAREAGWPVHWECNEAALREGYRVSKADAGPEPPSG